MFVCHGNICRSPMAEFIMKKLVEDAGLSGEFDIRSSATSCEEVGNGIYPSAERILHRHAVPCEGHVARRFTVSDYDKSDFIVVMEDYNLRNLFRIIGRDSDGKVWKLLDFLSPVPENCTGDDISDPWYHGDFSMTYSEIERGCKALLHYLGY